MFGSNIDRYRNTPSVRVTTNLNEFDSLPAPFDVTHTVKSVATSSTGLWAASSNSGSAAWTSNIDQAWNSYPLQQQHAQFNHLRWINNQFVAVGYSRSADLIESATTWTSSSAFDSSSWTARYNLLRPSSSYLNQVMSLGSNTVISVGVQLNNSVPLLLRSNDDAATWDRITLPTSWRGALHSVAHDAVSNRVWLGGMGWIATGVWADAATSWQLIPLTQIKPVRTLLYHQNMVVPTTLDQAWISTNGFDFDVIFSTWLQLCQQCGV
jgi:hypothetical protein